LGLSAVSHDKPLSQRSPMLISHRFSTVRMADRILVLENGRILEGGTHAELLVRRRPICRTVRTAGGGLSLMILVR